MSTVTSPVAPAARSSTLDAVRGFAVLGILTMNMAFFAMPYQAADTPIIYGGDTGADLFAWLMQETFCDGRMRAIFSMLFGAGLWLQWQKAIRDDYEVRFGDVWSRRCVWLVVFGMIHGYLLLWPGDILFTYGICGLFLFPFRRMKARGQLLFAIAFMLIATGAGLLEVFDRAEAVENYEAAMTIAAAGEVELTEEQSEAIEDWEEMIAERHPEAESIQGAIEAAQGSWLDMFAVTSEWVFKMETKLLYLSLFWDAFCMMLLGMVLMRWRIFTGEAPTWCYFALIALGYGVVAPFSWFVAREWADSGFPADSVDFKFVKNSTYQFARALNGLAHVSVLVLLCRAATLRRLLHPLAAVGRTAFSNYILQTLVCTTFFYGFGLGYYGHLSRAEQMLFMLGVWALALIWSPLWLRRFRFGPLEWLWRRLVHGRARSVTNP